ncbi:MAG: gluconokinase [Sporichthyaceae bacterium]
MEQSVRAIVVAGVGGAGKSTVGRALAARLAWAFCDADDLHSPEAVEKMRAGSPLTDAEREPWLDRVAAEIAARSPMVLACSALRRSHRGRLRSGGLELWFVLLDPPVEVLRERLAARVGHFMPATLLDSQLATLEPLGAGERGIVVKRTDDVEFVVGEIVEAARRARRERV